MKESRVQKLVSTEKQKTEPSIEEADIDIMKKIRSICGRGNNAEIKRRKDGSLAVMEVKKNIV